MKTVYVDVLISVNILIDFMLLLCTKRFLQLRAKLFRMILASLLGGMLSLTALLPSLPFLINVLIDIGFAALIVFTAFGKTAIKDFVKRTAVFFAISFSFCGVMVFIYSAFRPKGMEIYNDVVYFNISPVVLIILTLVCYYLLVLIKKLTKGRLGKQVCAVDVYFGGTIYRFNAMIDTGADIREPFSGEPVIIAESSVFPRLYLGGTAIRVIPFNSLGGEGILTGFQPDIVALDGKKSERKLYIGLCDNVLKSDIKAIVPYELIKNI